MFQTDQPIALSDENVKTNLNEIEGAMGIIEQLNPLSYDYNTDQFPHLRLSSTLNYGFSAQEVQQILPDIVKEVHHPAKYDTSGEMISPSEELLGIQYTQLIAVLTAGMKEQQSIIESQNEALSQVMDQMENLQQQINNCCSSDGALPKSFGIGDDASETGSVFGENELHQNTPNPFRSQTTISYTLEQGGKVLLNIFDKTGRPITTLVEAEQAAGTYRYEWDASGLPAGLYHYAFYVDGDLLVKKAIKLQD